MTEVSEDTQPAMTYPKQDQYNRWRNRADELDMSVSEFMQKMIEAGIKVDQGFQHSLSHDDSITELRRQRNDLQSELEHARERIEKLEHRLYSTERKTIEELVTENPGVTHAEIIQHVADTVPVRVVEHLEALEGDSIRVDDGEYYPTDEEKQTGEHT